MTQTDPTTTIVASGATTFTAPQIALTAALTGVLVLAAAAWRLSLSALPDVAAIGVLSAAAVLLWRISADMPELNSDGLPGFSANDWLAPVMTYVFLSAYTDLRSPDDSRRYAQTRSIAAIIALVVNVVTL